ncbi:MAG: HAD family hydrolase [Kiritimatiellia bacterium]
MENALLVWDWNGTLLDDLDDAVAALNRMLVDRGCAPTTKAFYRAHFGFPVRPFYAELGVDLARWDWERICIDFHRFFAEATAKKLREGARAALERAKTLGFRQCLLSAHREDLLRAAVEANGLLPYFDFVAGTDNLDGASKLERGRQAFAARPPDERRLFIGDTLHDVEVARALGGRCVLVSCGHQSPERLAAAGCPLADSLPSAVAIARTILVPAGTNPVDERSS